MARMFCYTVTFIPERIDVYEDKMHNGLVLETGVIAAKNYGKAVNRIVEYVGEGNVTEVSIYECENPLCDDELRDIIDKQYLLEQHNGSAIAL